MKFIDGTASTQSYAVVARRGPIALGVRPLGFHPGYEGHKDSTFVMCRLRSASGEDAFDDIAEVSGGEGSEDVVGNLSDSTAMQLLQGVVGVKTKPVPKTAFSFESAWPNIDFDKVSSLRASSIYGAYIKIRADKEPEEFVKYLNSEEYLKKMAESILEVAGGEFTIVRKSAFGLWFKDEMMKYLSHLIGKHHTHPEIASYMSENASKFGSHKGKIKKLLKESNTDGLSVGAEDPTATGEDLDLSKSMFANSLKKLKGEVSGVSDVLGGNMLKNIGKLIEDTVQQGEDKTLTADVTISLEEMAAQIEAAMVESQVANEKEVLDALHFMEAHKIELEDDEDSDDEDEQDEDEQDVADYGTDDGDDEDEGNEPL